MKKESRKVAAEASAFQAVYQAVDQRSEGRCEVTEFWDASGYLATKPPHFSAALQLGIAAARSGRCRRRGVDHHHLFKPRRAHHTADQVIHTCRACHDRMDYPFKRGRLCYVGRMGTAFLFAIRYASDKAFRSSGTLSP